MSSVKSAFSIAIGERGLLIAINLLSYVIIARLVSPEDVGLFSVTSAFVAMLAILRDFGTGYYIATTKDLTQEKLNSAFTFSFLIGFSVFLIIQAIAYPIGLYFEDSRVEALLRLISFNSLVLPITGCLMTSMRRRFLFGRVFWVNLSGTISGALVTIFLGYLSYGAYALAIGVSANYFVSALLAYILKPNDLMLGISLRAWREVFSFGGKNSMIGLLQQVSNSLIEILVGKYLGFVEAGLLSRGLGVVNLFNRDFSDAIRSVAIHSFSRSVREGNEIEETHRRYLLNYSCFGVFYFSFVFIFPEEAIYLLSGEKWIAAAPYLQCFAVMGAIWTTLQFLPAKSMALGQMNDVLKASLVIEPIKFLIGFVVIFFWQNAFYYSFSGIISGAFGAVIYWRMLGLIDNKMPKGLVTQLLLGFVPAISAVVIALIVVNLTIGYGAGTIMVYRGLLGGAIALLVFVAGLRLMRNPLLTALLKFRSK